MVQKLTIDPYFTNGESFTLMEITKILNFRCSAASVKVEKEHLNIWNIGFDVTKFEEICQNKASMITNLYYLDSQEIVRRSTQYHSETIGYLIIERLDRSKI